MQDAGPDWAWRTLEAIRSDYGRAADLRACARWTTFVAGLVAGAGIAGLVLMVSDVLAPAPGLRWVLLVADLIMTLGGLLTLGFTVGQTAILHHWYISVSRAETELAWRPVVRRERG